MNGQPATADMMRHEIAFYADMFNKMTEMCFRKCVPRFHDKELNTGECTLCYLRLALALASLCPPSSLA